MARLGEMVPSAEMSSIKAGSTLKELLFEVANMMSEARTKKHKLYFWKYLIISCLSEYYNNMPLSNLMNCTLEQTERLNMTYKFTIPLQFWRKRKNLLIASI